MLGVCLYLIIISNLQMITNTDNHSIASYTLKLYLDFPVFNYLYNWYTYIAIICIRHVDNSAINSKYLMMLIVCQTTCMKIWYVPLIIHIIIHSIHIL